MLLSYRKTERAYLFAEGEIFAVRERGKSRSVKVELSVLVDERFINVDSDDIRKYHIVRSHGNYIRHLTFKRERTLLDDRAGNDRRFCLMQTAFREFIDLCSRKHSAGIGGANER